MRRLVFLFVILFLAKIIRAADDETWLDSDRPENSAYFATKLKVSTLNHRLALWPGYLWISGNVPGLDSKWKVAETAFNLTVRFKDP